MLANYLRRKGVLTYDDAFIHTASGATLRAIKEEMLADYNMEVSK